MSTKVTNSFVPSRKLFFSSLSEKSSYYYVLSRITCYLKEEYKIDTVLRTDIMADIFLTDAVIMAQNWLHPYKSLWWVDTPVYRIEGNYFFTRNNKIVMVTSNWTRDVLRRSFNVDLPVRYLPVFGCYKPLYDFHHKSGFVTIGNNLGVDRKNIYFLHKWFTDRNIRNYLKIVSNEPVADIRSNYNMKDEDKYDLLGRSLFYVAMSRAEGFGLPPLEALSCGTPVIYLNAHTFKEILNDKVGIPVEVGNEYDIDVRVDGVPLHYHFYEPDPKEFSYAIETAKTINRDLYEDMVMKGIEYVEERFGYKKIIDNLVDILFTF